MHLGRRDVTGFWTFVASAVHFNEEQAESSKAVKLEDYGRQAYYVVWSNTLIRNRGRARDKRDYSVMCSALFGAHPMAPCCEAASPGFAQAFLMAFWRRKGVHSFTNGQASI